VADQQEVFVVPAFEEQLLEAAERSLGRERVRKQNLRFVSSLCPYQRGGLDASLQRTGDDEIELDLQSIEDVGEVNALPLAVFIERSLDIE
jgi:hypothetical protein